MSQRITIQIRDKIATCLTELPVVCGNSNYVVDFDFDQEWYEYQVKTARFIANGEKVDVVFEGNECSMPPIFKAKIVWVGVYAGNISTSTPAIVYCKPGILDADGMPAAPRDDVYAQILALLTEVNKGGTNVTIDGEMQTSFEVDKYVKRLLAELVDGAPETLDALSEIARALGNDPNFATTILTELGKKANTVYVEAEFAKRNAIKGDGEYSLITSPDNVAQDTWTAAINKDTEAYGGGSFASGGGSVAGISYEKYKELFAVDLEGKSEEEKKALYAEALERSTLFDGESYNTIGLRYWFAHAAGELAKAVGRASHAEGFANHADNDFAHAEGARNKSRGVASHTEGSLNEANAINAHAEGENNKANGANSHIEGYGNTVDAPNAHAEGRGNTIGEKAEGAHIEGGWNSTTGAYSHIEGQSNKASASFVHIEGINNEALHSRAHIEGQNNRSSAANQHISGKYNADNPNALVIVGNGTSENDRRNAQEILANGDANYAGDVYSRGERLARVSEIGGSSETKLYSHTVLVQKSSDISVCVSFVSKSSDAVNSYKKLAGYVSANGTVAASGVIAKLHISHLTYITHDVIGYALTFNGVNVESGEIGKVAPMSSSGYTVTDTVMALN